MKTLADWEEFIILRQLQEYKGNRTKTANHLSISIRSLRDKIKKYKQKGLSIPEYIRPIKKNK